MNDAAPAPEKLHQPNGTGLSNMPHSAHVSGIGTRSDKRHGPGPASAGARGGRRGAALRPGARAHATGARRCGARRWWEPFDIGDELVPWSKITPQHASPAVGAAIRDTRAAVQRILDARDAATPAPDVVRSLLNGWHHAENRVRRTLNILAFLASTPTASQPEFFGEYHKAARAAAQYAAWRRAHELDIFSNMYQFFNSSNKINAFSACQRKVILRDLPHLRASGGALRSPEQRLLYTKLTTEIASAQEEIRTAAGACHWQTSIEVESKNLLPRLRPKDLAAARARAASLQLSGYSFTLFEARRTILSKCASQSLRADVYHGLRTCGGDGADGGNGQSFAALLRSRLALAQLLGHESILKSSVAAQLALESGDLEKGGHELIAGLRQRADRWLQELLRFAQEECGLAAARLEPWDVAYYARLYEKKHFSLSAAERAALSFPAQNVVEALSELLQRLFGVSVRRVQGADSFAQRATHLFELRAGTRHRGRVGRTSSDAYVYIDLYARRGKRGPERAQLQIFPVQTPEPGRSGGVASLALVGNLRGNGKKHRKRGAPTATEEDSFPEESMEKGLEQNPAEETVEKTPSGGKGGAAVALRGGAAKASTGETAGGPAAAVGDAAAGDGTREDKTGDLAPWERELLAAKKPPQTRRLTQKQVRELLNQIGRNLDIVLATPSDLAVLGGSRPSTLAATLGSFFESWAWEKGFLELLGRPLPGSSEAAEPAPPVTDDLVWKLRSKAAFRRLGRLADQLTYALFDWTVHRDFNDEVAQRPPEAIMDWLVRRYRAAAATAGAPTPHPDDRFFLTITETLLRPGWDGFFLFFLSEALAADAFAKFKKDGIFNRTTGQAFLDNVLSHAFFTRESPELYEGFVRFRGRGLSPDALLEAYDFHPRAGES